MLTYLFMQKAGNPWSLPQIWEIIDLLMILIYLANI